MNKQKNRTSEQHFRATTQAAEAVALGTMAGGLALGAVQAREEQLITDSDHAANTPLKSGEGGSEQVQVAEPVASDSEAAVAPLAPKTGQMAEVSSTEASVHDLSEQHTDIAAATLEGSTSAEPALISEAIDRLVTEVTQDGTVDGTAALSLAGQILSSVAEIVSSVEPGTDLTSIGDQINAQVLNTLAPSTQLLGGLSDIISSTIDATLDGSGVKNLSDNLAALPELIGQNLGDVLDLSGLPGALLGNDGPVSDHGLLSSLFYSDGEAEPLTPPAGLGMSAESLSIPELSDIASTLVTDTADLSLGLLGLSYTDLSPDGAHPGSGGVSALGIL